MELAQLWIVVKVGDPQPEDEAYEQAARYVPPRGVEGYFIVQPLAGADHAAA